MIYFCIPAHNEERTVGVVLWKLRQVMAELGRDYQIIVVDDASTDSTPAVLSPYLRVLPLTVFRNADQRGYTDSLEIALREAVRRSPYPKRDAIIALQADFTEDPDIVPALIKRIEAGADIVASRTELEPDAPRPLRWGRRFLHWSLRKHEWSGFGDALSGLRAYRVVVVKRALEARGNARLLSWPGVGANVELLQQALPHSRRNEVVDTTIRYHRLQRASRYAFLTAWRAVRGAATGRANPQAPALPLEPAVAVTQLAPVEETAAPRGERRPRARQRQPSDRPPRHGQSSRRGQQQERRTRSGPPATAVAVATAPVETDGKPARKRRRSRRKKNKQTQDAPTPVVDANAPAAAVEPSEAAVPVADGNGAPKKKSRRGRRGGRGRRKGPRPNGNNTETQSGDGADAPPPLAAEGD